jgi:hypothetical protein
VTEADAIIDLAVVDREVDRLVATIALDGWTVQSLGEQPVAPTDRVIRYQGYKLERSADVKGRAGADVARIMLRFRVGTATQLGDGATYLSAHGAGAGVSAVLAALIDASFDADGHVGVLDLYDTDDVELDPDAFAVERTLLVIGSIRRASGRGMIAVG